MTTHSLRHLSHLDKAPVTELATGEVEDAPLDSPFSIISSTVARSPTFDAIPYFRTHLKYLSPKEQLSYHRRILGIFSIQLLLTWVWTYLPKARDPLRSFFQDHEWRITIPFGAALVLLFALYFVRIRSPWNWLVLLLFSFAQSVLFAALGVAFDTNVGFFNCDAVFSQVLIMILLAGVRLKSSDVYLFKLLNPSFSAAIAPLVVTAIAAALCSAYGRSLVTSNGFMYSLIFQLVVMLWLVLDTSDIYSRIYGNDTNQDVINLYTDLVVLALAVAPTIISCGFILEACDCDCSPTNGDFWGCYVAGPCFCDCDECCKSGQCKCCQR